MKFDLKDYRTPYTAEEGAELEIVEMKITLTSPMLSQKVCAISASLLFTQDLSLSNVIQNDQKLLSASAFRRPTNNIICVS